MGFSLKPSSSWGTPMTMETPNCDDLRIRDIEAISWGSGFRETIFGVCHRQNGVIQLWKEGNQTYMERSADNTTEDELNYQNRQEMASRNMDLPWFAHDGSVSNNHWGLINWHGALSRRTSCDQNDQESLGFKPQKWRFHQDISLKLPGFLITW